MRRDLCDTLYGSGSREGRQHRESCDSNAGSKYECGDLHRSEGCFRQANLHSGRDGSLQGCGNRLFREACVKNCFSSDGIGWMRGDVLIARIEDRCLHTG